VGASDRGDGSENPTGIAGSACGSSVTAPFTSITAQRVPPVKCVYGIWGSLPSFRQDLGSTVVGSDRCDAAHVYAKLPADSALRARVGAITTEITALVHASALEAVDSAFGAELRAVPAKRGPGRPAISAAQTAALAPKRLLRSAATGRPSARPRTSRR
jgi:hypothetical protein